ncbi:MAG: ATP-binding protein [Bacteroidetes bacterium]|nr:ATP-binding protein [Bacteroidota bacterium]
MLYESIKEQLGALGLKGMQQHFDDMVSLKPQEQKWPQLLLSMLKNEASYRQTRSFMYKLGLAKLPQIKSIDNFDLTDLPINHETLADANSMRFVKDHYNILIIGGSGTGKSHLAVGLAHLALQNNYRIRFYKFAALARELIIAQSHNYETAFMAKLQRFNLVVIDELGYLPIDPKASPLLFELFSNLYEKVSTIITTHLTFDEWSNIFGNVKATKAIIDRFTHHCLILETGNKSWRLKEGKNKKN